MNRHYVHLEDMEEQQLLDLVDWLSEKIRDQEFEEDWMNNTVDTQLSLLRGLVKHLREEYLGETLDENYFSKKEEDTDD